jgi:hypothetical protein
LALPDRKTHLNRQYTGILSVRVLEQ